MGKKNSTYEPGLEDLTPKARVQSTGPSSRVLDSLEQRGILREQETDAPAPRRPPPPGFDMGANSQAGAGPKKSRYEPSYS